MCSEIAANLNVLEFVKIFGEICKTLGVRWSNRYGVTAPLEMKTHEIASKTSGDHRYSVVLCAHKSLGKR